MPATCCGGLCQQPSKWGERVSGLGDSVFGGEGLESRAELIAYCVCAKNALPHPHSPHTSVLWKEEILHHLIHLLPSNYSSLGILGGAGHVILDGSKRSESRRNIHAPRL